MPKDDEPPARRGSVGPPGTPATPPPAGPGPPTPGPRGELAGPDPLGTSGPPQRPVTSTHAAQPVYSLATFAQRASAYGVDTVRVLLPTLAVWAVCVGPLFIKAVTDPRVQDEVATMNPDGTHGSLDRLNHWAVVIVIVMVVTYWLVLAAYTAVHMQRTGTTPGRRAAGIRLVRADGGPVTTGWVLYRSVFLREIVFGIGAIVTLGVLTLAQYGWALRDPQNRALHDVVARSRVVQDAGGDA